MGEVCFGIDIGGTAVKVGLFNTEGKLLNKWDFATRKTNGEESILTDTASFVLARAKELKLDMKDILGVGVGIPGPVKENGEVLELANLALERMNIEDELEKLLGLKVKAGNDANVAALGEYWVGGGKGYKNLVLVTLGTGVGGGIILNGSVLAGSNGAAGEIGHMLVNEDETKVCGCGKMGCLEQYASATGIVRLATNILAETTEPSSMRSYTELSAKTIFDCAKENDKLALQVVEKACRYLGITLANIAQVIDPEVFVIGGGVSKAGEIITETTKKYFNANVMNALKNKEFKLATLGNDAGIYGAAKLILG